jgi:hypothetical protein
MDGEAALERLAEDWITLWQSEIAGLAADREAAEGMAGLAAAWAALGAAWLRAASAPPFGRAPPCGPDPLAAFRGAAPAWPWAARDGAAPPAGPAAAAAASDAGRQPGDGGDRQRGADADAGLRDRLAGLERRLADLEGGAGGNPPDRRRPRRRKPSA